MPTWASDMSAEIRRLEAISDEDLSHPALMRAFFRGACGWNLELDCSLIFFYAICLGDEEVFDELMAKHRALDVALRSGGEEHWKPVQAEWLRAQDAFLARPDIGDLQKLAESRPF